MSHANTRATLPMSNLERLRTLVNLKLLFWDHLEALENRIAEDGEFSDRANDAVIEEINALAAALPGSRDLSAITDAHLATVLELAKIE